MFDLDSLLTAGNLFQFLLFVVGTGAIPFAMRVNQRLTRIETLMEMLVPPAQRKIAAKTKRKR